MFKCMYFNATLFVIAKLVQFTWGTVGFMGGLSVIDIYIYITIIIILRGVKLLLVKTYRLTLKPKVTIGDPFIEEPGLIDSFNAKHQGFWYREKHIYMYVYICIYIYRYIYIYIYIPTWSWRFWSQISQSTSCQTALRAEQPQSSGLAKFILPKDLASHVWLGLWLDYIPIIVVIIPIIVVTYGYMMGYVDITGWRYTYPSEKYESVGMMTFPI